MEVHDKDAPEYKLIKGLRAAGYPRPTEVDFMINSGVHVSFIKKKKKDCCLANDSILDCHH
jgi:hypothetical protein